MVGSAGGWGDDVGGWYFIVLLMPEQSKVAQEIAALPMIKDLLVGNNKRKMLSATVLLIIGFLVHVKNRKSGLEPVREKPRREGESKKKKVLRR